MITMILIVARKILKVCYALGSCCTDDQQSLNGIMDTLVEIENVCPVYKYLLSVSSSDPIEVVKCLYCWLLAGIWAIGFLGTHLILPWGRPLSYRNQSIDLQSKSMDWFLYDNGIRHERVKHPVRLKKMPWNESMFWSYRIDYCWYLKILPNLSFRSTLYICFTPWWIFWTQSNI